METLALLRRERAHLARDLHIGGGIPVTARIVVEVIPGLLVLAERPFLHERHARDHRLVDSRAVHGIHKGLDAIGVLEEIDEMQMRVAHVVAHRQGGGRGRWAGVRKRGGKQAGAEEAA